MRIWWRGSISHSGHKSVWGLTKLVLGLALP